MKLRRIFHLFLLFVPFFVAGNADAVMGDASEQKIRVLFRYDDFSATSNTLLDSTVFSVFYDAGIQLAVGVIPYTGNATFLVPDEKSMLLRNFIEAGVVYPTLHGYAHQFFEQGRGEFAGRSYTDQYERIESGKKILEESLGVSVKAFFPPWNEYDEITLRVLYEHGFDLLSAKVMDVPAVPDIPMHYLPAVSDLQGLKDNIRLVRRSDDPSSFIVVLFHSYDVDLERGAGISTNQLATKLEWLNTQPDLETPRWDDLLKSGVDLSYERLLANQKGFMSQDKLPLFWRSGVTDIFLPHVYWSMEYVPVPVRWHYHAKVFVYSLVFLLPGWFVVMRFRKFLIRFIPVGKYLLPLILLIVMVLVYLYAIRDGYVIGWLSWPVLMLLGGMFVGWCWVFFPPWMHE